MTKIYTYTLEQKKDTDETTVTFFSKAEQKDKKTYTDDLASALMASLDMTQHIIESGGFCLVERNHVAFMVTDLSQIFPTVQYSKHGLHGI